MNKAIKFYSFTGIFVIGLAVVFCIAYFRKDITVESGIFNLALSPGNGLSTSQTVSFDIQNEMKPSNMQTETVSITAGKGSLITNSGQNPIWISVRVTGLPGTSKIQTANLSFDENSDKILEPLMPGGKLEMSICIQLPKEAVKKYLVGTGTIEFYDYKGNLKLGVIPLKIINSKPNSCCCNTE